MRSRVRIKMQNSALWYSYSCLVILSNLCFCVSLADVDRLNSEWERLVFTSDIQTEVF